jgi:hypothetical protein
MAYVIKIRVLLILPSGIQNELIPGRAMERVGIASYRGSR